VRVEDLQVKLISQTQVSVVPQTLNPSSASTSVRSRSCVLTNLKVQGYGARVEVLQVRFRFESLSGKGLDFRFQGLRFRVWTCACWGGVAVAWGAVDLREASFLLFYYS